MRADGDQDQDMTAGRKELAPRLHRQPRHGCDHPGDPLPAGLSGRVFPGLSNATGPSRLVVEKVEKGELGIKSGKGWYDYSGKTRAEVLEEKNRALLPQLKLFMSRPEN